MDKPADRQLLRIAMGYREGEKIPKEFVERLVEVDLVYVAGCSDGDYIELTDKGRKVVGK